MTTFSFDSAPTNVTSTSGVSLSAMDTSPGPPACGAAEQPTILYTSNFTLSVYQAVVKAQGYVGQPVFLFGIVSNILTLLTLRHPSLKETPYTYLTALAAADLSALVLLFIEHQHDPESRVWMLYRVYVNYPLANIAATMGIWVMVLMTVERCVVLQFPFWVNTHCTNSSARVMIVVVFFISVLVNSPRFLWFCVLAKPSSTCRSEEKELDRERGVPTTSTSSVDYYDSAGLEDMEITTAEYSSRLEYVTSNTTTYYIGHFLSGTEFSAIITWLHSVLLNFLPMLLLIVFNSFLVYTVRRQSAKRQTLGILDTADTTRAHQQRRLTITLIIIVCLFIVLVLPSAFADTHIATLIFGMHENRAEIRIFQHATNFLMWLSFSLNLLMYTYINAKFQAAFRGMVYSWWRVLRLDRILCWRSWQRRKRRSCDLSSRRQSTFPMVDTDETSNFNNNKNLLHNQRSNCSNSSKENSITFSFKTEDSAGTSLV